MRKFRLISIFLTSQTRKQIITIPIFPSISRRKVTQTITFGQLIKYNMRNIFLEKSFLKCCGEASSRPFYKKSKFSQIESLKCYTVCFYWVCQVEVYQNILKLRFNHLLCLKRAVLKNKRSLELVSLPHFLHDV